MKKTAVFGTFASLFAGIVFAALYRACLRGAYLTLAITFLTTFYHFAMRFFVAYAVDLCRKGRFGADSAPFCISGAEQRFYKLIRVKKWKKYAPTYNAALFDIRSRTPAELCHNMVNAERGHEIIVLLSFVPIFFSKKLGGGEAFWITSVIAAVFDLQFVFIQRYNRARISKAGKRQKN